MATGRIGVTPTLGVRWSKAPAGGTTSLSGLDDNSVSLVYSVGYEQVYRNGVLLSRTNDYTATNGTTITLIDATLAGDIIEVFAQELVPLTDAISKGQFNAKGALLSATAASTPGVLDVGANDTVLTADSSTSTGLKWAAPAAGGMTLINTGGTTLSGASVTIGSIPGTYRNLQLVIQNFRPAADVAQILGRFNADSNTRYRTIALSDANAANITFNLDSFEVTNTNDDTVALGLTIMNVYDYANTTTWKMSESKSITVNASTTDRLNTGNFIQYYNQTSAITSIVLFPNGGNFTSGTAFLYGVK